MKNRLLAALMSLFLCGGIVLGSGAVAFAKDPFSGIDCSKGANSALCTSKSNSADNPLTGPNGTLRKATVLVARIAGIVAVIVIMVGGFMYITANGDANKAKEGRTAVISAVIGLLIIIFAQYLIIFILSKV